MSLIGTTAIWALLQAALLSAAPRQSPGIATTADLAGKSSDYPTVAQWTGADSVAVVDRAVVDRISKPGTDGDTPDRSAAGSGSTPSICHCDVLVGAAGGGGRNPECAIDTETQLPTGPLGSMRTAEPVATPSLL
jgi:hypothetical protein